MIEQLFNNDTKTRTIITIDDGYLNINQYDRFNKATSIEMNDKETKQLKEMLNKDVSEELDLVKIQGILNDIENRIIELEGEDSENRSKIGRAIDLLSQVEGGW